MDFKFKGPSWVGNIYKKFETVCQEVDDFVSQDTVKYVENQVQTVGGSMKFFCSGVVQDFIPPLEDPVISEAQAVAREENDTTGTYVMSMMDIDEKPELDPLSSIDPIKNAVCDLSMVKDDYYGALIHEKTDTVADENVIKEEAYWSDDLELISPKYEESSETVFNESASDNCSNIIHGAELELSQNEGRVCGSFLDRTQSVSDVPSTLISAELAFSVVSGKNNLSDVELVSSRDSLSTEYQSVENLSHANVSQKVDFHNPVDEIGCVSDRSDGLASLESFPTVSCNKEAAEMGLVFSSNSPSFEPNDTDIPGTDEAISMAGSSGSGLEHWCKCTQMETSVPSLDIGGTEDFIIDISDPSMETIELSDNVKLEHSSVFADDKLLYAASCRARKHRSYKKLIQDVFASKKRLTKEYEQLAIWYGDIDIEPSNHPQQNISPFIVATSSDSRKSSENDICEDSEWELL